MFSFIKDQNANQNKAAVFLNLCYPTDTTENLKQKVNTRV